MSDHSNLLEDTQLADAIATYVGATPGHKVVGLHDNVMVRDSSKSRITSYGFLYGDNEVEHSEPSEPYATVEIVLASPIGRVYAERHKVTLDELLVLVGITSEQKAS